MNTMRLREILQRSWRITGKYYRDKHPSSASILPIELVLLWPLDKFMTVHAGTELPLDSRSALVSRSSHCCPMSIRQRLHGCCTTIRRPSDSWQMVVQCMSDAHLQPSTNNLASLMICSTVIFICTQSVRWLCLNWFAFYLISNKLD